jgi:hypothetical protein
MRLIIDGKIYELFDYRKETDIDYYSQKVLGLFGMQPGIIRTRTTTTRHIIDTLDVPDDLYNKNVAVSILWEQEVINEHGRIVDIGFTDNKQRLKLMTNPIVETEFIPE